MECAGMQGSLLKVEGNLNFALSVSGRNKLPMEVSSVPKRWNFRYILELLDLDIIYPHNHIRYRIIVYLFPRSWGPAAINCLVFPLLPICGIVFTAFFFTIGIYVYNYPHTENLGLCHLS